MKLAPLSAIIILTLGLRAVPAVEPLAPAQVLPEEIARSVSAVVRIERPDWLMDQADALLPGDEAAAAASALLAEFFFTTRDPATVDGSRPALVAWREGEAPLLAVIPVTERQAFIDAFGSPRSVRRMLVRTGERDGTVIYRQATPAGIREYRLLLRDGYAYLAASREECEALAARPLSVDADAPPLVAEWRGDFLAEFFGAGPDLADLAAAPQVQVEAPSVVPGRAVLADILRQVERLGLTVAPVAADSEDVRVAGTLHASGGTALAAWIGRQSNAASRLLGLVLADDDFFQVHARIRWQGELEAFAAAIIAELEDREAPLGQEAEQDLRDYFALLERQGEFAMAVGQVPDGSASVVRMVHEQPQAGDYLTLRRAVTATLEPELRVGEFEGVADHLAYRSEDPTEARVESPHRIFAAVGSHLISVEAPDPQVAEDELRELIAELERPRQPLGAPGVAAVRLRVDRIFGAFAQVLGREDLLVDPLVLDLALRVERDGAMAAEVEVPVPALRQAIERFRAFTAGMVEP